MSKRSSETMTPSKILIAAFACLAVTACGPHGGKVRGVGHAIRGERHDAQGGHGLKRACRADIEQFCAADQKGRERRQCLQEHRDKLSDDCRKALDARGQHGKKRDKAGETTDTTDTED